MDGSDGLDLFAGTGSITFELLSRGCRKVTAVEKNKAHSDFIAKTGAELKAAGLDLIRGDVFRFLQSAPPDSYDIIFADPPYSLANIAEIPSIILRKELLRKGGLFIMEHPKTWDFSHLPYFCQRRIYGSVNFSIFLKEEVKTGA